MFGQNFDHLDSSDVYGLDTTLAIYLITSGGGTEIRLGGGGRGLAWEAAKQPIIHAKRLHAKVKNWGGF